MTVTLVIVGGIVLLVVIALCVGVSLDTEAQRRERRRLAAVRQQLRLVSLGVPDSELCGQCPYRRTGA